MSSRAKEFKTRLGIFLHKSDLGSDTANVGKLEWNSKYSKEGYVLLTSLGPLEGTGPDVGQEL